MKLADPGSHWHFSGCTWHGHQISTQRIIPFVTFASWRQILRQHFSPFTFFLFYFFLSSSFSFCCFYTHCTESNTMVLKLVMFWTWWSRLKWTNDTLLLIVFYLFLTKAQEDNECTQVTSTTPAMYVTVCRTEDIVSFSIHCMGYPGELSRTVWITK